MRLSSAHQVARGWASVMAEELRENQHNRRQLDGRDDHLTEMALAPLVVRAEVVQAVERICDFLDDLEDVDAASQSVAQARVHARSVSILNALLVRATDMLRKVLVLREQVGSADFQTLMRDCDAAMRVLR